MINKLSEIASLSSGIYEKPDYLPDTLYLQSVHFDEFGDLDSQLKPQLNSEGKIGRHLLQDQDVLFAAKGVRNFGVVYKREFGKAVASSSIIVIRINQKMQEMVLPDYLAWFLTHTSKITEFHKKQLGTTVPSISIKELNELEVNIPAMERQKEIVKIQELRNKQKDLTRQLEVARESKIQQLLINALKN